MTAKKQAFFDAARATTFAIGLVCVASGPTHAQYPSGNVSLVVPFPPGGSADIVARMVAEQLQTELDTTILVENRDGASTAIGAQAVAGAPADGHTLLFTAATTFTTNPHVMPDLQYRFDQFEPVAMVAMVPFAYVVRADFPAQSIEELRDYALANPGIINNATNGIGSTVHVLGELAARELGIEVEHVHYRGAAPAMIDLLGGNVDTNVEALANAVPNHDQGGYRALAMFTQERIAQLPDVPTFTELGYEDIVGESWFAVFAPAGTPTDVLDRLNETISAIVASPGFVERMQEIGNEPVVMSRPELGDYVRAEEERLGALIREADIRME